MGTGLQACRVSGGLLAARALRTDRRVPGDFCFGARQQRRRRLHADQCGAFLLLLRGVYRLYRKEQEAPRRRYQSPEKGRYQCQGRRGEEQIRRAGGRRRGRAGRPQRTPQPKHQPQENGAPTAPALKPAPLALTDRAGWRVELHKKGSVRDNIACWMAALSKGRREVGMGARRAKRDRWIWGVCGGIVHHFGWSFTGVRIVVVLLAIFILGISAIPAALIYILLGFLLPESQEF